MTLRSMAEVEHWVASNSIEALRKAVDEHRFAGPGQAMADAWLKRHDARVASEAAQVHREAGRRRDELATEAALRSAMAAERSADASIAANRIAWLALLVALAALAVTAWPYIKAAS